MIRKLCVIFLSAGIIVGSTVDSALAREPKRGKMSNLENRIGLMFKTTRTVCVGRFLLDIPAGAEVVYGPAWVLADIERYPDEAKSFPKLLEDSMKQAEKDRSSVIDELTGPDSMLGKVIEVRKGKILFSMNSSSTYKLRAFLPLVDDLFVLSLTSWEKGMELSDLRRLTEVSNEIVARPEDLIPDSPGVCVDGAFILDSGTPRPERVTLGLRMRELNDVHFSMAMTTKDQIVESDGLERRLRNAELEAKSRGAGAWYASIKFLKRGNRVVDAWSGYEIQARKSPQKNEGESHEFAYTSHGEPNNPMRPVLELEMHSGVLGNRRGATKPSITDAEAIELWDRLLGSIRPRPVGNAVQK